MASYAVYRIKEQKSATCAFWLGMREIDFRANKPMYVKAESGRAGCLANRAQKQTANNRCLRWKLWEKLYSL
jgi:hypothetical protein